ncbi:MAG: CPBP family intramembrane glutamic endopeptidase [Methyloprofundus sp.]|nr:CPBP family intramembrane metalloprotease [Methyloprofundus sp.]MDT8426501.1 CPBP family intramembrane glutamic endopeptidase [Methyloprofundus sp.]
MNEPSINPDNFFKTACYFESSLILVAIVLGWVAGIDPFAHLEFNERVVFNGILGTLPLCIIFLALNQTRLAALEKIRKVLHDTLGPSLIKHHWTDLFVLAAIAGISEEILFRGVIQPWLENSWGMLAGLLISSLIFGLIHAVTLLYFIMATAVSVYLGMYLDYGSTRNLLTPIIIHWLYDFFAFMLILHAYRLEQQKAK